MPRSTYSGTRQRAGRHQRLRNDQEEHAHQHRDDDAEEMNHRPGRMPGCFDESAAPAIAVMIGEAAKNAMSAAITVRSGDSVHPHQPAQAHRQDKHGQHGEEREQRNAQDIHGKPPRLNGRQDRRT
jgi:hypothetical protein